MFINKKDIYLPWELKTSKCVYNQNDCVFQQKKGKQIGRQMHGDIPNYQPKKKYFNDALILSQFQIFSASF